MKNFFLLSLLALGVGVQATPVSAKTPTTFTLAQTVKPQAKKTARAKYRQEQLHQIQPEYYDLTRYPITDANEERWRNLLWTTAVVEPEETYVAEALNQILALTQHSGLSKSQQKTVYRAMQVGTQLYLNHPTFYANLKPQFLQIIEGSNRSEWVAMALSGLAKGGMSTQELQQLSNSIRTRFPKWSKDVVLETTLRDVAELASPPPVPPLRDLLNWTIAPGQLHLYVICTNRRQVLCEAVLKGRDGKFVQTAASGTRTQLWSVPLLLRSIHDLGWNFFYGQTPQGVYRIEGTKAPDPEFFRAYGQFSLVKLFVPFETGVREFLPGHKGPFRGSIQSYQALLPPSWRGYFPIEQTYWAGQLGRALFRIHGGGDSPDLFSSQRNLDSYNWNPTIGCLSALELYDEAGLLQQADMPKILGALRAAGGEKFTGYLIVVEMPASSNSPISLEQIAAAIQQ